jgi:hypothetical protein
LEDDADIPNAKTSNQQSESNESTDPKRIHAVSKDQPGPSSSSSVPQTVPVGGAPNTNDGPFLVAQQLLSKTIKDTKNPTDQDESQQTKGGEINIHTVAKGTDDPIADSLTEAYVVPSLYRFLSYS